LAPYKQNKDSIQVLLDDGCILNLNIRETQNNFIYGSFSKIKRQKGKFHDILSTQGASTTDELYVVTEKNDEYFIEKAQPQIVLPEEYDFIDKNKYLEEIIKKQKEIILTDSTIEFNGKREIEISIKDNIANTKEAFFENYMEKDFLTVTGKKYQIDAIISDKEVILSEKDVESEENTESKNQSKEKVRFKEGLIESKEDIKPKQDPKEEKANHFFYSPTTIKNLDYLENDKISILNNGGLEKEQTVKNGKINIPNGIKQGIFGIWYESIIITQPLIGDILDSFLNKSIDKLLIRLKNSKNFYIGWNLNNMQEVSFAGYTYKNNEPVPLYTGDIKPNIPSSGWDSFTRLFIKNISPTPLCLSGIYYETTIVS